MTDITYIVLGVILIATGAFVAFGRPLLQSKLSTEQLATLRQVVNIAVYAAEQLFGAKVGKDKKAYALEYAKQLLAKFHLTFNEETIDAAIEAQVKELKIETGV